jgi:predicted ATPase
MKASRASDYWRRLEATVSDIALEEFIIEGIRGIANNSISAKGSLNVLCGTNGTGKSTVLEAAHLVLAGERPNITFGNSSRFGKALLSAKVKIKNGEKELIYELAGESKMPSDHEIVWLNPGALSAFLQRDFSSKTNFDEYLTGSPTRDFSPEELRDISYLVCRVYTKVSVTEIEDFEHSPGSEGPETIPVFVVTCEGATYRSEEMGIGEHALFLLFWYTRRIKPRSLLLVEEIETHISFRSQIHALNDLVAQSLERKLWILLTTHSPAILERMPRKFIKLLHRGGGTILIQENPSEVELSTTLGVQPIRRGVCIVEDSAAKAFLLTLFQLLRRDFALQFEITIATSNGHITTALKSFPTVGNWLRIIGVYDADTPSDQMAEKHKVINLPGTKSPELEIIPVVKADPGKFAAHLNIKLAVVSVILDSLEGSDEHDWFAELVKKLGANYETCMRAAVELWLDAGTNRKAADGFIENLLKD